MTINYNNEELDDGVFKGMSELRIVNLIGGNSAKWKLKLKKQSFKESPRLLELAKAYNVNVIDYVVDARRLEQEASTVIGKNIKDKYFRASMRGFSPSI
jgi:hypothetical protein